MKKDVEVRCPECGGVLLVDVITGKVLRHRKAGREKEKKSVLFDEVVEGVAERSKNVPGAFDSAFSTVKKRQSGLDDLFKDAVRKVEENEEEKKKLGKKENAEEPDEPDAD